MTASVPPVRSVRMLDRAAQAFGCLLLVALLVCVLLGVVTRAWGDPLIWTDEAARMLMVWLAGTGWILASRQHGHVRVRFFQDLLPRRLWGMAETAIQLLMVVFGLAVAGYAVVLVRKNLDLDATALPISMAWLYGPLIPAGLVTALQGGMDAVRRPRSGIPVPGAAGTIE